MNKEQRFLTGSSLLLVASYTVLLSFLNSTWTGYPQGCDVAGHLSKIQYILQNWPDGDWCYVWYTGMPLFELYGPVPEYLVALFAKVTGLSVALSLTLVHVLSIILSYEMIFLSMLKLTNSRYLSLASTLLAMSSFALFGWGLFGGMYPKVMTFAIFLVAFYFLIGYVRQSMTIEGRSRKTYLALELALALSIVSHPIVGTIAMSTSLIFVLVGLKGWRQRVTTSLAISLPAILSTTWFWLPFFFALTQRPIGEQTLATLGLQAGENLGIYFNGFVWINFYLSPLILPLLFILLGLTFLKRRARSKREADREDFLKRFAYVSIALVAIPMVLLDYVYFVALSLLLPVIVGLLIKRVSTQLISIRVRSSLTVIVKAIFLSIVLFFTLLPPIPSNLSAVPCMTCFYPIVEKQDFAGQDIIRQLVADEQAETNYRFGVPSDATSWFNYRYKIPQTRGYAGQGILGSDMIFWFETSAWGGMHAESASYPETNFLLDWFGVKWFIIYPPYDVPKYLQEPNFYQKVAEEQEAVGFVYKYATPITIATRTPSMLVIGKDAQSYNIIFRDLAFSDHDSRFLVPVRGDVYVDDFTLDQLQKFDAILLYGYNYHSSTKAWELLQRYVEDGGGLVVDTGLQFSNPDWNASSVPLPSPVARTIWTTLNRTWNFTILTSAITEGIDFEKFTSVFPWGVSTTTNESIRAWTTPVLCSSGYPIIAMGEYGKGRVIWSGMNLPWHIALEKNEEESRFLARMIDWVSSAEKRRASIVNYRVERPSPEKVIVHISNEATGVVFKESYHEGWRAYVSDSNGQKRDLQIFRVGYQPGFMYLRLPRDMTYPVSVVFQYGKTSVEYFGYSVSLISIFLLVSYALAPSVSKVASSPIRYIVKKIKETLKRLRESWIEGK